MTYMTKSQIASFIESHHDAIEILRDSREIQNIIHSIYGQVDAIIAREIEGSSSNENLRIEIKSIVFERYFSNWVKNAQIESLSNEYRG